jgi:hypothetical protein
MITLSGFHCTNSFNFSIQQKILISELLSFRWELFHSESLRSPLRLSIQWSNNEGTIRRLKIQSESPEE